MTRVAESILKLPMPQRGLVALKEAVKIALAEHARDGVPIYIWEDGRVVQVAPDRLLQESTDLRNELT